MPDVNDIDLMRKYADGNSESAFAELVQRHLNFVYSVALRYVGNAEDARDVAQAVFIILARKISSLRQRATLTGWLYETTRFTARQLLRTKARRQAREQEAYMDSIVHSPDTDTVWKQLAPILEDAMARLNEKDRALLALRFFENKSVAETASLLGLNEWTVRKRAERSVEKLRVFFYKRGIAVPASVLTSTISANSIYAAPSGLAVTISAVAFTKGATASISTLTLIKGALKLMIWSKTKFAISTALAVILVAGVTTVGIQKVRAYETNSVPAPGKLITQRGLLVRAVFAEVPDKLLDSLNLPWQPGDSGSSTVVMPAAQENRISRGWRSNLTVIGRTALDFAPNPGSTAQASVSSTRPAATSPTKMAIGSHLEAIAALAADSKSVDLKLYTELQQPAGNSRPDYGSLAHANPDGITTSMTVPLDPAQAIIIRSPITSGSFLAENSDNTSGSRSLIIVITPAIQDVTIRLQPNLSQVPLTWTNTVTVKPANN